MNIPVENIPDNNTPEPPNGENQNQQPQYWERRRATIADYDEEAFNAPTNYERNAALLVGDGFALAARLRELHAQVEKQMTDPLDQYNLLLSTAAGHKTITREVRSLQDGLDRIDTNRHKQEREWLDSNCPG